MASYWQPLLFESRNELVDLFKQNHALAEVFSKQQIAKKLFPGEVYNDDRIRRIISLSKKSLEEFLSTEASIQGQAAPYRRLLFARYLLDHGHFTYLEYYLRTSLRQMEVPPTDTSENSLVNYHLFRVQSEAAMRSQQKNNTHFQAANDFLDLFYIQEKVKLHAAMRALTPLGPPHDYEFTLEDEINHWVRSHDFLDSPLIQLYHAAGQLASSPTSSPQIQSLMELLREKADDLSPYDFRQLAGFFLNHLDQRKLTGGEDVRRQIFALLKELIDRKVIYIEGQIVTPWFNRIVFAALHLSELDWLEGFLYAHEGKIAGEYGQQVWELAMLRYTFGMGAYSQVLHRIGNYRFTNERFNLWSRVIRWKALFELAIQVQESEKGFDALEKFELDLRATLEYTKKRQKLHPDQLNKTLALLHWFRRLANWRFYNRETTETMIKDLAQESLFPHELQWIRKHLASIR